MSQLYLALDTETGGLDPKLADVLTIYIAVVDLNFKILDEVDLKLKPNDRLPVVEPGAMKVNGIDIQAHLADSETITYEEAAVRISAMLKKHLKKNGRYSNLIPLGHNIPFDLGFIHHHIMNKEAWEKFAHYRNIDTNPIVWLMKDSGWFPKELGALTTVVDYLGIPKRAAHNAKEDTLMCLDVYRKLLDIMRNKKESSGGGAQQDLIALLEAE